MARIKVRHSETNMRLDRWLKIHYPSVTHSYLEKLIRKKYIKINGKKAKSSDKVKSKQEIFVPNIKIKLENQKLKKKYFSKIFVSKIKKSILYSDKEIIVINKPHNVAVQGGTGLTKHIDGILDYLKFGETNERPRIVHRLDKETTGVLLIANTRLSAKKISDQFQQRKIKKEYWALVSGVPLKKSGRIENFFYDRNKSPVKTITDFKVLKVFQGKFSWLRLDPITGKKHQLRKDCQKMGCPIVGDRKYPSTVARSDTISNNKLHLHARKIFFKISGRGVSFEAPLPLHMKKRWEEFKWI